MKTTATLLTAVLTAILCISCASTGSKGSKTAYVQILSSGTIVVNDKPVSVGDVGKTLKRSGYSSSSPVKVHIPKEISDKILKAVTVSLTNSGFRRVLFIKPKQAKVDVSDPKKQ